MRLLAPLVKAMCAMMRCTSLSFPAGLGVGKGGTKLSQDP